MESNAVSQLEKVLTAVLKEEYSFYQSLFVMLDQQRDYIRFDKDEKLLELFAEIERCYLRIKKSEEKITQLKEANPRIFKLAAVSPNVRKLLNSIVTLVKKSIALVDENEDYLNSRYDRIKEELGELRNSEKILQYLKSETQAAHLVDGKN